MWIGQVSGGGVAVVANVTVAADGSFVGAGRDLKDATARNVVGVIAADGAVAGSIASLNVGFVGTRGATGTGPVGYYRAPALNGLNGAAHTIVAGDGTAFTVAHVATTVESGASRIDAAGGFTLAAAGGGWRGTISSGTGALTLAGDGATFAGLRDDVPRSDRLGNISTRGRVGTGDDVLIAGFVITGTTPRPVLVRALGPALGGFGVSGTLADPRLRLFRGATVVAESDNWGAETNASAVVAASAKVGAFELSPSSGDACCSPRSSPAATLRK